MYVLAPTSHRRYRSLKLRRCTRSMASPLRSCDRCARCSHPILTFSAFLEIVLLPRCLNAFYQLLFWKLTFFFDTIFTDIMLYTLYRFLCELIDIITRCSECCVGSLLQYRYTVLWPDSLSLSWLSIFLRFQLQTPL